MPGAGFELELTHNQLLGERQESAAVELLRSIAYAGLQRPLTALAQPFGAQESLQFIDSPHEAQFNTSRYWIQQAGSAVGMIGTFLLAGKAVSSITRRGLTGSALSGNPANRGVLGLTLKESFLTGALHDTLLRPTDADDTRSLAVSRLGNGLAGGLTVAALTGATLGLRSLGKSATVAAPLLRNEGVVGITAGLMTGPLVPHAETLLRHGRFASPEEMAQSAHQMAMIGGVFGAWQQLRGRHQTGPADVALHERRSPGLSSSDRRPIRHDSDSLAVLRRDTAGRSAAAEASVPADATRIISPGGWYDKLDAAIRKAPRDHTIVVAKEQWAREAQQIMRSAKRTDVKIVVDAQAANEPKFAAERPARQQDAVPKVVEPREIAHEVQKVGVDPETAMIDALAKHQVVAVGEYHVVNSAHREFGASVMPKLKQAGVTHLAIESTVDNKGKFIVGGQVNSKILEPLLNHYEFRRMLQSAHDNGIKIVPVDIPANAPRSMDGRNLFMADSISGILSGRGNPKVVFWVGNAHLTMLTAPGEGPSAVSILRSRGTQVSSFYGQHDNFFREEPVRRHFTPDSIVAVPVDRAPVLRSHTWLHVDAPEADLHNFSEFNWVLMYPKQRNLDWD